MRRAVELQVLIRTWTGCHHLPVETADNILGCMHGGLTILKASLMKIAAAFLTPRSFLVGLEIIETD